MEHYKGESSSNVVKSYVVLQITHHYVSKLPTSKRRIFRIFHGHVTANQIRRVRVSWCDPALIATCESVAPHVLPPQLLAVAATIALAVCVLYHVSVLQPLP